MKRIVNLALVLTFTLTGGLSAGEERPVRSISVSGTAEVKIAPDQITWRISLTDTDKNLLEAKKSNDEKVKSVVALRDKLGIGQGDLETGQVNVNREYTRNQHGQRGDFKHFAVTRSVTIRQRDLKRIDEFLDTLVSSAEMEVGFSFESSRMYEVRAETRLKALRAAKDKAAAMAKVVGAKLGPVLTINEHSQRSSWRDETSNLGFVESTPAVDLATEKFVPGAISVQVTVYATFELE